jgi:hypothetical protein
LQSVGVHVWLADSAELFLNAKAQRAQRREEGKGGMGPMRIDRSVAGPLG